MSLCFLSSGCIGNQEVDIFYGEDITPSMPAEDFTLTDEDGNEFNFYDYEGDIVVVAFLFTRCPDVCPVVSANLAYVAQLLGDLYRTEVQILTVTVDPWTDNSSVLNNYSSARGLDWPHLTGELEVIEPVWRNFEVGLATYDSDLDGDGVADVYGTPSEFPISGYEQGYKARETIGDTSVLKFEVNGQQVLTSYDADGDGNNDVQPRMDPTLWYMFMRIDKNYIDGPQGIKNELGEINIYFDNSNYDLIGWQIEDIYQNLTVTFIYDIKANQKINNNLFKLPKLF